MNRPRFIFAYLAAALFGLTSSGAPFEPEKDFSITESWRWHELEPLANYSIYKGVEGEDEKLFFTSEYHLLVYDGYLVEELDYPMEDESFSPHDLFYARGGYLFMTSSRGVFRLWQGTWKHLVDIEIRNGDVRELFARSASGLEYVSLPNGVHQILAGELIHIPGLDGYFSGISFDRSNRMWFTEGNANTIGYVPFTPAGEPQTELTRRFPFNYPERIFPWVVTSPDSDDIWSTNWRADIPPLQFDPESQEWKSVDLRQYSGDNSHSSGNRINESDMMFFTKSSILVNHRGVWHSIGKPEFDIPTNLPFYIQRKNGRLILGGRGERTYEIDYKSDQQESFHGLHFQCDIDGLRQWFISIGGEIVEHQFHSDLWLSHEDNVIDSPLVIIKSDDDTIWAAGAHEGVAAISRYNGREWIRDSFPELNGFFSHHSARQLPDGRIIFGSGDDDLGTQPGGVVIYQSSGSDFVAKVVGPPAVPRRPVGIGVDQNGQIWFGGPTLSSTELTFDQPLEINESFSRALWIDHVMEDSQGQIWVAQWERGLFTRIGDEWVQRKISTEIADSQVSFILQDEHRPGNMWFATNSGISRFDGERWYPQALPGVLRFNRESGTLKQSSDGAIWINFATRNWFFRRNASFYLTERLTKVFKTVRYQPDENPPTVSLTTEIPRSTAPSNIHVSWQGVDRWSITAISDLKYSYRLNDEPWSEFRRSSNHVLLDLPSGRYRFQVRALDLDGNLSAVASSAEFLVVPPLWQRTWFIALVIVTIAIIIVLTLMLVRQRFLHIVKMEEFKLQFFTNISHELRTPLTVILGPLESQLEKLPPGWNKKPLEIAYKNAQRTLTLIDQILDFRRAETGKLKVNLARSDLSATVNEVFEMIKPLAEERSQTISLIRESNRCLVWYDAEIIQKILNNLISNSVKYTHLGGTITVRFRTTEMVETIEAELIVEDNGSGIPAGKIDDIFEVFYRAGNVKGHKVRGSGIGLAYTKNLIEACHGTIRAESPIAQVKGKKQGTRFTVSLPVRKVTTDITSEATVPEDTNASTADASAEFTPPPDDARPLVLLVEDDEDISNFLRDELSGHYRVLIGNDGAEGLKLAEQHIPDMVLTDVMMPEMDGKELCRRLKTSEATSHIPVVMLTALKSEMHELEGLEIGADDYLAKPIKLVILKQRIHNLLESRQKLQERFKQQKDASLLVASEITSNRVDQAFMEKTVQIVESHLENPLFDVEVFAEKLFMSRMTLYRKFKAITGDTPGAFIRSIRMNKAAGILATGEYNVSETAELVGFTDLSSFSTAFKNYFDVPPSKYTQRH